MNNDNALPKKKLRLLSNILLVLASLSLILGLAFYPLLSPSLLTVVEAQKEVELMANTTFIQENSDFTGISADTTVLELLERDRAFHEENQGWYQALTALSAVFIILLSVTFLRLALAWRRAEPFGRDSIIGLRCLGGLLIFQFLAEFILSLFVPRTEHYTLFVKTDIYEGILIPLMGAPTLSSGILFVILSWALDYSRQIKKEQSLTI